MPRKKTNKKQSGPRRKSTGSTVEDDLIETSVDPGDVIDMPDENLIRQTQAGDAEGLDFAPEAGFESVKELADEGQAFEAAVVDAIENVPLPDYGPLRTREVSEDDVPPEYRDLPPGERQS